MMRSRIVELMTLTVVRRSVLGKRGNPLSS
jgi:hypothetical protein